MTEKVKLPKEICDALDYALYERKLGQVYVLECVERAYFHDSKLEKLAQQDALEIMRALVLGYEPEMTAEEQLKEKYFNTTYFGMLEDKQIYRDGIRDALEIHGIHYDWLGDAE